MKFIIESPAEESGGKRKAITTFDDLEAAQRYVEGTRLMIRWRPDRTDTVDAGGVMASIRGTERNDHSKLSQRLAA